MTLRTKIEVGLGAAVLGWMLLFGHCPNWRAQQRLEMQPRVLEQTKKAKKAKRRPLTREQAAELCGGLRPIAQEKFVGRLGAERPNKRSVAVDGEVLLDLSSDLGPALLDSFKLEKVPYGGKVDVELTPGAPAPTLTVTPNARPWLEGMSRFRLSALVGAPLDPAGSKVVVVPRIDWRGLRTGRIDYGAGAVFCPSRSVIVGGVVGFE